MAVKFKDYYEILGVPRTATQAEIQRAYRKLARQYHPDVSKEKGAEAKFKEINEAYQVLGDAEKRSKYDTLGPDWKSGQDFRPPPGWEQQFRGGGGGPGGPGGGGAGGRVHFGGQGFDFGPEGASDFFEMFFGPGSPFARNQAGGRGQGFPGSGGRPSGGGPDMEEMFGGGGSDGGQTHEAELTISLEDAYRGATRQITLRGSEDGNEKTYQVRIPAGTTEGSTIRLAGQGGKGAGPDSQAGDLLLRIRLAPHPQFQVDGHDLSTTLPIAPWEAALGAKVSVPTLDGQLTLTIPAGSQSGQRLRLKGKGLPRRGGEHGDMFAVLKIVVPKTMSDAEKKVVEEWKKESKFNPREG